MKCHECQEHILSGYLDNELNVDLKTAIDGHLSECNKCKEFAAIAQKAVVEPFKELQRETPPEAIWDNIKEEIEGERLEAGVDWLGKLKELLSPKPVFAIATIASLVLMVFVFAPGRRQGDLARTNGVKVEHFENIDYVAGLLDEQNGSEEYGTSIEEYFL